MSHLFCHACGHPSDSAAHWPRTCSSCHVTVYHNPLPVSVVLLPVDDGLLVVRRLVAPQAGQLALPGGYVNHGEDWRDAGARELFEEAGVRIEPATLREVRVVSVASRNLLIVFSVAPGRRAEDLEAFVPNDEAAERRVLTAPEPLAFTSHTEVMHAWFSTRGDAARRVESK